MLAAGENVADVFVLVIAHLTNQTILERLGKSDDGVQRRAQFMRHGGQELRLHSAGMLQFDIFLLQGALKALALSHIAGRGEYSLQLAVAVVKGRGVIRHHSFLAVLGADGQFVVAHLVLGENAFDRSVGAKRVGKEILAGRAN